MKQANKRWRGFTLVEILLVVVIMAVIAVLAVPDFSRTYKGIELRKTADDLAYRARYAQSYAITKNTPARLEFDPSFTQYWLTRRSGDDAAQDTFIRLTGRLGGITNIPRDIQVSFEEGNSSLDFYPDGTMDRRRIHFCRGLPVPHSGTYPAGQAEPSMRDRQECVLVSTQEQRGFVHVSRQSDKDF